MSIDATLATLCRTVRHLAAWVTQEVGAPRSQPPTLASLTYYGAGEPQSQAGDRS